MNDPLKSHLLDLLSQPESSGLILAGGYGLTLKRMHILLSGERTLSRRLPEARATIDLDLFLRLDLFSRDSSEGTLRSALDRLNYEERTPKWQFENKATNVVIDLHAREPAQTDDVKVSGIRVGSGSNAGVHGRIIREAFAVEEQPIVIPIDGVRSDGSQAVLAVTVPHPYAWFCMKVRAAMDWARWSRGELTLGAGQREPSPKHAFDACLIVAMLTVHELSQVRNIATVFREHPIAVQIREEAADLFSEVTSQGWVEAQRQSNRAFEHDLIWPTMKSMLEPM